MYACIYCDPDFSCGWTDIQPEVVKEVLADLKKNVGRRRSEREVEEKMPGGEEGGEGEEIVVDRRAHRPIKGSTKGPKILLLLPTLLPLLTQCHVFIYCNSKSDQITMFKNYCLK